jgi:short-subunit dehydrogenase
MVVTGASSGIGAATAVACARAGMDAVVHGRQIDRLQQVADQVRECGRAAEIVVGDVTEPGFNRRLLDAAQERFGGFYAVFANAGYGFKKPSHELEMSELRQIFEVNFFAGFELLREAARRLIAQRRPGHLLMCSSAVAKFTLLNFAAYSATKAAQNHFCRAMRLELRPYGIEVASVHPITTRTEFCTRSAEYVGAGLDSAAGRRPGWWAQSPQTVADAVVRCLRRPRPEVWTSVGVRLAAGLMTVFPRLMDLVARRA